VRIDRGWDKKGRVFCERSYNGLCPDLDVSCQRCRYWFYAHFNLPYFPPREGEDRSVSEREREMGRGVLRRMAADPKVNVDRLRQLAGREPWVDVEGDGGVT
jgi:hypothetical protein